MRSKTRGRKVKVPADGFSPPADSEEKVKAKGISKRAKVSWTMVGLVVTAFVGWLDLITGYEVSFSVFYLVPIGLVTWIAGRPGGILISVASTITWLLVKRRCGLLQSLAGWW